MLMTSYSRSDASPFSPESANRRENGTHDKAVTFSTPLSIWETDDQIQLAVDLPGLDVDDIDLNYKNGMLWILGERKFVERDGQLRFNDRWFGRFERVVKLPESIDPDTIDAELSHGVLVVTFAKRAEAKPHKVKVRSS